MGMSPSAPAAATALDPAAVRAALEARGWRCTPQRLAVYDCLAQAEDHPTAEQVCQAVRRTIPKISLATVYKALEALAACGLVARLTAQDGSSLYDARREDHYHLRCLRSGRVEDVPTPFDPDLIDKLDPGLADRLRSQGFRMTGYRLELVGYFEGEPGEAPASPGPPPPATITPEPGADESGGAGNLPVAHRPLNRWARPKWAN